MTSPSEREIAEAVGYIRRARLLVAAGNVDEADECMALALEYLGHPTHEDNDDEA